MGKISRAFETFHEAIGHHWKWWLVVTVPGSYAVVSAIITRINGDEHLGFLVPTVSKVSYTIVLLSVLLAIGMWVYAHKLRLASIPQLNLLMVLNETTALPHGAEGKVFLVVENMGITALTNCLVNVDGQYQSSVVHGHQKPRPIRTEGQLAQNRTGQFNLRGGEKKRLLLCHYEMTKGDTFARVFLDFEDDDTISFDPEKYSFMDIGLYSEGPPQRKRVKFERSAKDGLVTCLEFKEP
jgi:hypothetical protein